MISILRVALLFPILLTQVTTLAGQATGLPIESVHIGPLDSLTFIGPPDSLTFDARDLADLMRLKAPDWRSGGTPFSRRALKADAITIKNFYLSRGYLEVQVVDSFAVIRNDTVEVFLAIKEGRQFSLADVAITGNHLLTEEEIITRLNLKIGEPYSPVEVSNRLETLQHYYQDQGKLTIDILEEIEVDEGVHLRLSISEGLTYTVGNIIITGLDRVPEWYVRRELLFQTGDTFNRSVLLSSQQRVFESGLFAAVEVIPTVRGIAPGVTDIEVRVRELGRGSFDLSAGFSQTRASGGEEPKSALSASVQWWHSRIRSTIIRTGITLEGNLTLQNPWPPEFLFAWDLLAPWTFGVPLPAALRLYLDRRYWIYREKTSVVIRRGVDFSLLPRRSRRHRPRGALGWEFVQPGEDVPDTVATAGAEWRVEIDYFYQGVDNLVVPRDGAILQVKSSVRSTTIKEIDLYYSLEADIRGYRPFFRRSVFACRLKGSYLGTWPEGKSQALEPLHLLYLGGSTSLRGWEMPGSFAESGGVAKWLLNVELRVPVWKMIGFEVFTDAGGLSAFGEQDDPVLQWILGMDAGAGLLINTPLGPIRLDFAFPFYAEGTTLPPYAMQVAFLHTF